MPSLRSPPWELLTAIVDHDAARFLGLAATRHLPLDRLDYATGTTPLMFAIQHHEFEIVEFLAEESESLFQRNSRNDTTLILAVIHGNQPAFDLIIDRAPSLLGEPNSAGQTPLMIAAQLGLAEMVKTLINRGVDINSQDLNGNTAVHHAASYGQSTTLALLTNLNAELSQRNHHGWTALDFSFDSSVSQIIGECERAQKENRVVFAEGQRWRKRAGTVGSRDGSDSVDSSTSSTTANNSIQKLDLRLLF